MRPEHKLEFVAERVGQHLENDAFIRDRVIISILTEPPYVATSLDFVIEEALAEGDTDRKELLSALVVKAVSNLSSQERVSLDVLTVERLKDHFNLDVSVELTQNDQKKD